MRYGTPQGFYELNPFPGCNQIVVSNHAFVYPEHRGKGVGTAAHQERLKRIAELGYDYAICTVISANVIQKSILHKAGWTFLDTFLNQETLNVVEIWGRHIKRS